MFAGAMDNVLIYLTQIECKQSRLLRKRPARLQLRDVGPLEHVACLQARPGPARQVKWD